MRKITSLLFLLVFLAILQACSTNASKNTSAKSTDSASLDQVLESYGKATKSMNVDKILPLIYPPLFDVVSKEDIKKTLAGVAAQNIKITSLEQSPTGKEVPYSKGIYRPIAYTMTMESTPPEHMVKKIRADIEKDGGFEKYQREMGMIMQLFTKSDKVSVNKETLGFKVTKSGEYLAINENKSGWKLIDVASVSLPMLEKADNFPKKIKDKLVEMAEADIKKTARLMKALKK